MSKNSRCLYHSGIESFLKDGRDSVFGVLCENYHGNTLTSSREAWVKEIDVMKDALAPWGNSGGHIVFEYDIPRLGTRVDVVLLLRGIVLCIEFKVGQSSILEGDIDQVLDYALDLKYFHKFSEDRLIVPILVATKYKGRGSTLIQPSLYDDRVANPLVTGRGA